MSSNKKTTKFLNLNSPIFDEVYNRNEYTDILVNLKKFSIENEKREFVKDYDYSDTMYLDYKMKSCDETTCPMCNLYKLYDFYKKK